MLEKFIAENSHLSIWDVSKLYEINKEQAFYRDCFSPGHFVSSMLILNREKNKVLLMGHIGLQRWQQFGGHMD